MKPSTRPASVLRLVSARAWIIPLLLTTLMLAACGGGSGSSTRPAPGAGVAPPSIQSFTADSTLVMVGDDAVLTARFTGGQGRIDPGVGPVQNGEAVRIAAITSPIEFTLVVTSAAGTATRKLSLDVGYRDRYRPTQDLFSAVWHTANLAADGRVILAGGWRGGHTPSDDITRFDPASGQFTRVGGLTIARQYHRTTTLADGRMLVTGGDGWLTAMPTAEIIDPIAGVSQPTGAPHASRADHTATRLADGRVLVTGGIGSSGAAAPFGFLATAEIWDPATGQFRLLDAVMSAPRVGHSAALLPDGRVLIIGGWTSVTSYALAEIFDPATEEFTAVEAADRRVRFEHSTVQLEDGSVLVLGGAVLGGEGDISELRPDTSVLRFFADGTGAETLPALALERALAPAVLAADGRVLLLGGMGGWEPTARTEAYLPGTGSLALADLPSPRFNHTVTRLADGRFLVAGGESQDHPLMPLALIYD